MNLSVPVIVLVVCLIAAGAIICGLGAVVLAQKKGQDGATAIIAGFAAAGVAVLIGCALMGAIADMA
ncbi:hypothetical protein ACWF9G_30360 [Nocardia sp. NPDC055029]